MTLAIKTTSPGEAGIAAPDRLWLIDILSFALAAFSYYRLEQPMMKL